MATQDKYQSLIELARQNGVNDLSVQDQNNVLHVSGTAPSEQVKQKIWDEYSRLDPNMRAGDLVLDIGVAQGGADEYYTVQSGDSLSKIGSHYGVPWKEIYEANSGEISDPDKIYPGQKLRIPRK
jgi:nucleoid-associated protein YgaU